MHTPGKIEVLERGSSAVEALLYNFDIGRHELKREHKEWLKYNLVGYLGLGGSLSVVGSASRSGSNAFNLNLSQHRLQSVINFLREESPNNFKISLSLPIGEAPAAARDGSEDPRWRAVLVSAWTVPTPPVPPPLPTPKKVTDPPLIERTVYAEILVSYEISSGMIGLEDSPGAEKLANGSMAIMDLDKPYTLKDMVKMKQVATARLRKIIISQETTATSQIGYIGGVQWLTGKLYYAWGRRKTGFCIVVDGMDVRGPLSKSNPDIYVVAADDCDLFVNDPSTALKKWRNLRKKLIPLPFEDYTSGLLEKNI